MGVWETWEDLHVLIMSCCLRKGDASGALNIERSRLNKRLTHSLTRAYIRVLTKVYVYAHGPTNYSLLVSKL